MSLSTIEKKVFGALVMLSDKKGIAKASTTQIAKVMGYKASGGALTFALKILELNNHIQKQEDGSYKVFI